MVLQGVTNDAFDPSVSTEYDYPFSFTENQLKFHGDHEIIQISYISLMKCTNYLLEVLVCNSMTELFSSATITLLTLSAPAGLSICKFS